MKEIVIIGAGDLGREVVWLIEDINRLNPTYVILGFLDDDAHPYAFVVMVEGGSFGITSAAPIANTLLQAAVKKY